MAENSDSTLPFVRKICTTIGSPCLRRLSLRVFKLRMCKFGLWKGQNPDQPDRLLRPCLNCSVKKTVYRNGTLPVYICCHLLSCITPTLFLACHPYTTYIFYIVYHFLVYKEFTEFLIFIQCCYSIKWPELMVNLILALTHSYSYYLCHSNLYRGAYSGTTHTGFQCPKAVSNQHCHWIDIAKC